MTSRFPRCHFHFPTLAATVWFLSLGCMPGRSAGAVRVLMVGLSEYPAALHAEALPSVENDIKLLSRTLESGLGVPAGQILKVQNRQATTSNIIRAFKQHLVTGCRAEDVVLFFFSGHGCRVPDMDGDEKDGNDEALLTYDFDTTRPETQLTDDVINRLLLQIPARHVITVFDSCHSGTATRSFTEGPMARAWTSGTVKGIDDPFNWSSPAISPESGGGSMREGRAAPNQVFISACEADQRATMCYDPRVSDRCGILTQAFCSALSSAEKDQSLDQLQTWLRSYAATAYQKYHPTLEIQRPVIESSRRDISLGALMRGQAFGAEEAPVTPRPVITPPPHLGVSVNVFEPSGGYTYTQNLRAEVRVDQPCYVRLYYAAASGIITQIYPNGDQPLQRFSPGTALVVPGSKSALRLGPPKGRGPGETYVETLIAIASSTPFEDAEARTFLSGRYNALPAGTTVGSLLSRSIEIEPRRRGDYGYATASFRLVPPR